MCARDNAVKDDGTVGAGIADACAEAVARALEPYASIWEGDEFAEVVCVTSLSLPIPEEVRTAIGKALVALGYAEGSFLFCSTSSASAEDIRFVIESVAPVATLFLDRASAIPVLDAYGADAMSAPAGVVIPTPMRSFVVLEDFPASLVSQELKRAAWHQMQAARRITSRL